MAVRHQWDEVRQWVMVTGVEVMVEKEIDTVAHLLLGMAIETGVAIVIIEGHLLDIMIVEDVMVTVGVVRRLWHGNVGVAEIMIAIAREGDHAVEVPTEAGEEVDIE